MTNAQIVSRTLDLLGGQLRDAAGEIITAAAHPVIEVRGDADARAALANRRRVAITVPIAGGGQLSRIGAVCLARVRIAAARRRLAAAGAVRTRVLAAIASAESLLLVYELGGTIQPYIEQHVVLQPRASAAAGAARSVLQRVGGLAAAVDLVVIVGDPA
jgi:hypothetical protein